MLVGAVTDDEAAMTEELTCTAQGRGLALPREGD